ncbi:hypothetical protein [Phaeobacter gallaeciensis]|uniref:Peptidase M48 domain-containing protein n=1 Tax=Phaeobacter gallaeciensis TaxID=60890 RepID=A0ABD4XFF5_9RHOB|nr:hypothetical protein [Phaeobacter gallaeciensis]MDE4142140.1 hypothetical protein [Phaeobacter gallaeciensis]MDE4146546.1 hypothetical protein [Phaeobacter gallaeciensis]MDE4150619.1 hypothetical protein [Phaeobacter gallaeciensis]MDE4154916.1 hypothetical protein [Phaeobacter gallaeciensis]MDE4159313.1 hypothetical protein [Phaeobacter gallaeciensis]
MAKAFGSEFRPESLQRSGELLLTAYFEDIQNALSPAFDEINFAEFTRTKLNAHASAPVDTGPYIHIDQHLDRWLLLACQLLSIRAFYKLEGRSADAANFLMKTCLEMAFDSEAFDRMKPDSVHLMTDYPECLRFAHHLSIGALVFVCCHELAHHAHGDIGRSPGHDLEYAADREGLVTAKTVYASSRRFRLLRPVPFGLAGIALLFWLFDLIECLAAQSRGLVKRQLSATHPFALDRLARLRPDLEANPDILHFVSGYGDAVDGYRQDLGLDDMK